MCWYTISCKYSDCSGLTSIDIPNSVTSIGRYAFENCSGLTSVIIPESVTSIGENPYSGCSGLTSIKVESGNTDYDSRDNCNAIIKTETNELISGCQNTFIPESVTSIGDCAFLNCIGLTSITIPDGVTRIGHWAFSDCSGLTSLTIGKSLSFFLADNFYGCDALLSVTVKSIMPPDINVSGGNYNYFNQTNATLYVPYGCKAYYEDNLFWCDFKEIVEMEQEEEIVISLPAGKQYATFVIGVDLDLEGSDFIAYTGVVDGTQVILTPVTKVPAGTGVLLKGKTAGQTGSIKTTKGLDALTDNDFVAVLTMMVVPDNAYILATVDGVQAFYKANGNTIRAGHAYLKAEAGARLVMVFEEATDIVGVSRAATGEQYYDLNGRRVAQPRKGGLYILNGKKVVVK